MKHNAVIDVTKIKPQLKHAAIFEAFDELKGGETILIHNDHDPKPLYYQMLGERGHCFQWNYLVKGPVEWEVEITKNDATVKNETIGQMVAKDIRKAEVFKKYDIDFCCGGKITVEQACAKKGLDTLQVKEELEQLDTTNTRQHDYASWKLSFLSDYIVNIHHGYIQQNAATLKDMSQQVAEHHGKTNPELEIIRDKVDELIAELNVHMKKEERILFPYIKQLENNAGSKPSGFASVMQPISVMEHDHDVVGELLQEIKTVSHDYSVPGNACNSFKFLYHKLKEFEDDLHMHIHLENNILFPKAVQLESAA
jgi:regulator of cell morphogenesis and NO signaling